MKKGLFMMLAGLIIVAFLMSGCAAPAPAPTPTPAPTPAPAPTVEKYNWRMQRYSGPTETMESIQRMFEDDIYTLSGGQIEVTSYTGGEIVPNDTLLEALGKGTLEMVQGYGGYWPGLIDVGIVEAGIPAAWTNYSEPCYLWYGKGFIDVLREAYAEQNVYYLCPAFGANYDLLTKVPVHSLADMKGLKIRTTATVAGLMGKFDIATVYLPPEELYLALSTGTIDGLIYGGAYDYHELKLEEVASYYTSLSLLYPGWVDNILINMDVWNELPAQLQRAVEFSARRLAERHFEGVVGNNYRTLEQEYFTTSALPAEDVARLSAAAQEVWDEEAAKSARVAEVIEWLRDIARAAGRL